MLLRAALDGGDVLIPPPMTVTSIANLLAPEATAATCRGSHDITGVDESLLKGQSMNQDDGKITYCIGKNKPCLSH